MSSRVAAIITRLAAQVPSLGGIGPEPVPNNAVFPYVTIIEIGSRDLESLSGDSGIARSTIQLNVWDKDFEVATAKLELCKAALRGFTGVVAGQTIRSVNHDRDNYLYDGHRELHQCICRYSIWWGA